MTTFFQSALSGKNPYKSTTEILAWLEDTKKATHHDTKRIGFSQLRQWGFDSVTSNLVHSSGGYFSIEGIRVATNWGNISQWCQPIINQPEIGFLGIITKRIDGVLYFLMQAKIEPGNINTVQLSPTLQATKSNYTQVHKGAVPNYLEYFMRRRSDVRVLMDQLQSEQGARFLKKRNRNIIIEVLSDIEVKKDFCWVTLRQIKELLEFDNVINMDTRTVISGITHPMQDEAHYESAHASMSGFGKSVFQSEQSSENSAHSLEEVISWLTELKAFSELTVERIHLDQVTDWHIGEDSIYHSERKYFSVIAVESEIGNREVASWTQPLVESAQEGVIGFIVKEINGVLHFLIQAKLECGNFDNIELAPTVQCLTGDYREGQSEYDVPYLEYILDPSNNNAEPRYAAFQSEEGGRFFREQNKNVIVQVGEEFSADIPENFIWLTLNQIQLFLKFNNYLNIQARSLLAALKYH